MIVQFSFSDHCSEVFFPYSVEDFGAKADGTSNCTAAIQAAIDRCAAEGGGVVGLSDGTYIFGTIELKGNVEMRIAKDATLYAVDSQDAYPDVPNTFVDGTNNTLSPERKGCAFVYAYRAENVSITGDGTIDLGGERFAGMPRRPFLLRIIECGHVTPLSRVIPLSRVMIGEGTFSRRSVRGT